MSHIWNNMRLLRPVCGLFLGICLLGAGGCSHRMSDGFGSINQSSLVSEGLAVGFVTNHSDIAAFKPYQRLRYANKLASAILESNPRMQGQVDSYSYVSARMGKTAFKSVIDSYRLEGDLGPRALEQLKAAQLRRRYLMLATISPVDEAIQLPVDVRPAAGRSNPDVEDYQDVELHTVRLKAVRVQVYDTYAGRKVQDETYSSDDQDIMLATHRTGRRYLGNSLFGALANSVANSVKQSSDSEHPPAPSSEQTLDYLWRRIAQNVPGAVTL